MELFENMVEKCHYNPKTAELILSLLMSLRENKGVDPPKDSKVDIEDLS